MNNISGLTTEEQYDEIINSCKNLFLKKAKDYGTSWRIMRLPSITDQIFIKAQRIRTLEETKINKVGDSVLTEYVGIINYCVIALIQIELQDNDSLEIPYETVKEKYEHHIAITKSLMQDKNHDYGEAWRDMRISSLTDLILMKLLRVKQIEDNNGETSVSEGVDANYMDIINYSVFALIRLYEERTSKHLIEA